MKKRIPTRSIFVFACLLIFAIYKLIGIGSQAVEVTIKKPELVDGQLEMILYYRHQDGHKLNELRTVHINDLMEPKEGLPIRCLAKSLAMYLIVLPEDAESVQLRGFANGKLFTINKTLEELRNGPVKVKLAPFSK